jgi:quinohemoprotein ethanol dehydrogenase
VNKRSGVHRWPASFGVLLAVGCAAALGVNAVGPAAVVDEEALRQVDLRPGEWLAHGRDLGEQRYSPLARIDDTNVAQLGLAYAYETGTERGLEATPLMVDGTLYITLPWSVLQAIDARTGALIWEWDPEVDRARGQLACCDVVNRGAAYYEGLVYLATLDGRLAAVDAGTGELVWQTLTVDLDEPYTITGAPRIAAGNVVIGNGGAEYGVRGYVSAYDARTGEMAWRFYVVPGDPSEPFESPAMEYAAATWTGEWWQYGGGGTAWDSFAYDPDLDLLYVGTGNGSPWNWNIRSPGGGDNLFLSSIVALRPATGELVWYYQTTPGDTWDFTATQHMILADIEVGGRERKVLMQAPKNGFFYVLDRETGELISAEAYTEVTWAAGIDMDTGRPIEIPEARYEQERIHMKPGPFGGHNWHPMSYNPGTGLVYIPVQDASHVYARADDFEFRPGVWNTGTNFAAALGVRRDPPTGSLVAWDPVAQQARWAVPYDDMWNGGTLSTAGNLVFQGTSDGRFVAYRATDGRQLWEQEVGGGIIAAPITYELDGIQYVAVLAGWGGSYAVSGRGREVVPGRLLVFVLGGTGSVSPAEPAGRAPPTPISFAATEEQIAMGATLYAQSCAICHGAGAESGSGIPDLRYSSVETYEQFHSIVLDGARQDRGMPGFARTLSGEQADAIRVYLLERRSMLQ